MPINNLPLAMADNNTLHQVLYHDDNIVIELDLDKKIQYINVSAETFLGANKGCLLNIAMLPWCEEKKLPYPQFLKKEHIVNEMFEEQNTTTSISTESCKLISWRIVPLYLQQQVTGYLLFGKDVTQIKKNELSLKSIESKLNLFINSVPGYHWWKDLDGRYLGCNDQMAQVLKLDSPQDIIGKTDFELPWAANAPLMIKNDQHVIAFNDVLGCEEIITSANNIPHTFFVVKMPLKNDKSEIIGTIGSSIDTTDRKIIEEELRQTRVSSHAKTEFIANMSHDIRTPLSGVVGMSKVLEEHTTDPEEKQYAHWVNECGQQLLSLLNEILDVISTDDVNDSHLRPETFDLYKCIDDIAQLERPAIKLKKLDLNIDIPSDVPRYVVSDRIKLYRIILNFLGNAIKFTQRGSVGIAIKLIKKLPDAVRLEFRISDTGQGIPDALQPKLFDRFFQANSSTEPHKGHGLGLHIAQSYVQLLGGEIKLNSNVNQGTTFYFELTLQTGAADDLHKTLPEQTPPANLQAPSSRMNDSQPCLLLIEDNHIALLMVEKAVRDANCRYASATNAQTALQLVASTPFDLIITDIGLPDIPGTELAQIIRKWELSTNQKPVPIIGLTAHTEKSEAEKCMQAGMNKVLIKPITSLIIQNVIDEFIPANQISLTVDTELPRITEKLPQLDNTPLLID